MGIGRRRIILAMTATVALVGVGCSDDSDPVSTAPETVAPPSSDAPADTSMTSDESLPEDVTPSGVLLAATLIASGNVDDAVASGLVTPDEVDEAIAAIEAGTLDRWVALAEGR
jgi:hypothetical protein